MAFWSPYYNHNHLYQPLLTRSKRALENPTAEDMKKFSEDVAMFKEHKKGMIGNLTCVLAKMGKLNANLGKHDDKFANFSPAPGVRKPIKNAKNS